MGPKDRDPASPDLKRGEDLHRLVEIEDEIARDLDRARTEAESLEAEARRGIAGAQKEWAAQLEREIGALRLATEADCARRMRNIEEESRRQVARFDGIDGEQVEALAAIVMERLLETLPEDGGAGRRNGDLDDHPNDQGADPGPAAPVS